LSSAGALEGGEGYHLILCRNLFIYLNARSRAVLAESLSDALLPGGLLIVGAGDRVAELNARFTAVKPAAGFGFVHKTTRALETAAPSATVMTVVKTPSPEFSLAAPKLLVDAVPTTATEFFRRAMEYKERGNMRQAERRCRQALYLAPGYLPALELLQTLWHVHPNARLRRALHVRIQRVRTEGEVAPGAQRTGEPG
jgi:hypothetical protein